MSNIGIQRFRAETKTGHTVSFFFNPENNLVVVDLIHKNELGGVELLRTTLDTKRMLSHCRNKGKHANPTN